MCWSLNANDAKAARATRKAAASALCAITDNAESLSAAELIVGELLSNAARHADGHVCLEISAADGFAQLSVHDTSPMFSIDIRRPPDEMSESGRGLFIISELAGRIDVVPLTGIGKCVSVRLNLPIAGDDPFTPSCSRSWLRGEGGVCMRPRVSKYQPQLSIDSEA